MLLNCGIGEDSWESLRLKEIKPVHSKGNQSWIFNGRTDTEAETPILGPPDAKNWLTRKNPDSGKDWRQEEKGMTEGEMVRWHHQLNGHEFEQAPGVSDGQEAWHAEVHGVTERWTWLSELTKPNWILVSWWVTISLNVTELKVLPYLWIQNFVNVKILKSTIWKI